MEASKRGVQVEFAAAWNVINNQGKKLLLGLDKQGAFLLGEWGALEKGSGGS